MSAQPVPDATHHPVLRGIWAVVAVVVGAVGAAAAIVQLGPVVVLLQLATVVPVVGILGYALAMDMHLSIRAVVEASVLSGVVVVLFAGYVEVVGAWSLLAVPLVVLTAPRLVSIAIAHTPWGRRRAPAAASPSVAGLVSSRAWERSDPDDLRQPPQVPDDMREASLNALCRYWTDSARSMEEELGPRRALDLVVMREACLEEMRRRDDHGFERWLAAGADTTDPAGFLAPPGRPSRPDPA
jgi:hypothetical protein